MIFRDLSVLVPFFRDSEHRDRLLWWFAFHVARTLPGAETIVGLDPGPGPGFSRAAAVNDAAGRATRDVFLICDCDLVFPAEGVARALTSGAPWMIPYTICSGLSQADTAEVLDGAHDPARLDDLAPVSVREGTIGGMCLVPREAFARVGGMDPRFRGWGCEDNAFYMAMGTLVGEPARLPCTIHHLWHPDGRPASAQAGLYIQNRALYARYLAAHGDPGAMSAILDEWRGGGREQ